MERREDQNMSVLKGLEGDRFLAAVEEGRLPEDLPPEQRQVLAEIRGILAAYREMDLEEPPEAADRVVLEAARSQVAPHAPSPALEHASWWSRLSSPGWSAAAAAAVLLLVAGGVLLRRRHNAGPGPQELSHTHTRVVSGTEPVQAENKVGKKAESPLAGLGEEVKRRPGWGGSPRPHAGKGERLLASAEVRRRRRGRVRRRSKRRSRLRRRAAGPAGASSFGAGSGARPLEADAFSGPVGKGRATSRSLRMPAAPPAPAAERAKQARAAGPREEWQRARRLARRGMYRQALAAYRRLARTFRRNPQFLWEWAKLERRTGHRAAWKRLYGELQRKHPEFLRRARSRQGAGNAAARPASRR